MAITFPASPTNGQTFTSGNKTWQWDGTTWLAYGASLSPSVLKVDAANARVGVNNQSPAYALDVNGTIEATQFLQGTDYLSPYQGFRNAIINGDFRINQRAFTSVTTNATFGFDRWRQFNSGGTVTMSSQSFTVGSPAATGFESETFCRLVTASQSASGDFGVIQQPIENVRTFANSTVTISFWAKATSGTPKVAVELAQVFGIGGSPSADVDTLGGQVTLSTSWARYSVTMTIPNINGKTIGTTANTSFLNCNLWVSAGSTFNSRLNSIGIQNNTFDFWGVQVERGSVATPFEQRPIQQELALCQRYYYTSGTVYGMTYMSMNTNQTGEMLTWAFPVTMRAVPTAVQNFVNGDNTVLASMFLYNNYLSIKVYPFNTGFGYGAFSYGFNVSAEF
jgi:hypothetical protein